MVRILHCLVKPDRGGAETLLMNAYRNIDRGKIQFDFLVSIPGVYEEEIKALGGRVYHTPFISQAGPFAYAKNLRRFFSQHPEYHIVHSHMDKFSGMVLRQAQRCGVPVRIAHSHNTNNEGGLLYKLVKNYYGRYIKKSATHLLACSAKAAQWLFGARADEAVLIKNGVDTDKFYLDDKRDRAHFLIGNIGRLVEQKNQDFLLDIFGEVYRREADARLVVVGEGGLEGALKAKTERLGLSGAVTFTGSIPNVADVVKTLDVLCMPSLFEGLSLALIEAQACGVACVVSDTIPKEANVTGDVQFVPLEEPPRRWADAILAFRGYEKKDNSAIIAEKGYDIKSSAAQLQQLYLSLSGGEGAAL